VNAKQSMPAYHCVVLIDSLCGSTVTNIVLGTGCNFLPVQQVPERQTPAPRQINHNAKHF